MLQIVGPLFKGGGAGVGGREIFELFRDAEGDFNRGSDRLGGWVDDATFARARARCAGGGTGVILVAVAVGFVFGGSDGAFLGCGGGGGGGFVDLDAAETEVFLEYLEQDGVLFAALSGAGGVASRAVSAT